MSRAAIVAWAAVSLAGCAHQQQGSAVNVGEVVRVRCVDAVPPRPVFSADTLTGDEDIHTKATTLWADSLETRAHIGTLETALRACARQPEK
jgi:hypothetical protein